MSDDTFEAPATAPCTSCKEPVAIRRPSMTGAHFCPRPSCQRDKQRFYYQQRKKGGVRTAAHEAAIRDDRVIELVFTLAQAARVSCECGRTDALPGYPHPTPGWTAPCFELGAKDRLPSGFGDRIMLAIYPRD